MRFAVLNAGPRMDALQAQEVVSQVKIASFASSSGEVGQGRSLLLMGSRLEWNTGIRVRHRAFCASSYRGYPSHPAPPFQ